jgi:AraC-like DNA-binding protein
MFMDPLFQGTLVNAKRIIYTPSGFARTNLLHLQETGELEALKPHTSSRKNLISYLFLLVLKGSGTLTCDGIRYELSAGDCAFIDCRKAYSHRSSPQTWTLKWVHFYGSNMKGIYEKYAERGGRTVFRPDNPKDFEDLLEQLFDIAGSADYIRDMRICEKLTTLLTLLMAESWHPENKIHIGSKRQSLQNVKDYLDQHYREKITLDHLAGTFFINKFYLARIFKEQFGVPINGYLAQVRITHAKQLLRFGGLTIEETGRECGFDEPAYFTRVFKKVEGITPGEFRRMW